MGCTSAGLLIEEKSNRPDHLRKALALHEKGCGLPDTGGCLTRQELESKLPGRYSPDGYDRRACDGGNQQSLACYNAGVANERGVGGSLNLSRAHEQLQKACKLGMKKACRDAKAGQRPAPSGSGQIDLM